MYKSHNNQTKPTRPYASMQLHHTMKNGSMTSSWRGITTPIIFSAILKQLNKQNSCFTRKKRNTTKKHL